MGQAASQIVNITNESCGGWWPWHGWCGGSMSGVSGGWWWGRPVQWQCDYGWQCVITRVSVPSLPSYTTQPHQLSEYSADHSKQISTDKIKIKQRRNWPQLGPQSVAVVQLQDGFNFQHCDQCIQFDIQNSEGKLSLMKMHFLLDQLLLFPNGYNTSTSPIIRVKFNLHLQATSVYDSKSKCHPIQQSLTASKTIQKYNPLSQPTALMGLTFL